MALATFNDVLRRYTPLTTMIGSADLDVSTNDISSIYIADAEGIIGAYLGSKYTVPLTSEPILTSLTSDIAIFKCLEDRAPRIPDFLQKRYDNAIATLESLRDGKMVLTASGNIIIEGGDQEAWSNVLSGSDGPVFKPVEIFSLSTAVRSDWF